ncbi:MAG: hypothetical protein EA394_05005 [Bacteroidia bacterium]|nr:MAG: hypothetical protein EA394_05005 [Bacteroidia bacterium]
MTRNISFTILAFCFAFMLAGFSRMGVDRIMLSMESSTLQQGKAATVKAELFYQSLNGRLVTKFVQPLEQIMVTNRQGELSIYSFDDHTVYRRQSMEYSSENNLIYFFLNGKTQDMGLRDMGFTQISTEFSESLMITKWMPPAALGHLFSHIELVHEDYMPIYAGYYDAGQKLVKKVYYSDYEIFPDIILPMTITEFNYLPDGDSIISRVRFSDIHMNRQAVSAWFDFEIPDDAKIID